MDGILPIYKDSGMTSYDVIRQVKRLLPKGQKIGHAGTLDPFADGVLLLLLGRATKMFDEIQRWKKTYRAVARLGAKSDTLDNEGKIVEQLDKVQIFTLQRSELQKVADQFVGEIEQVIPQYSAAKYKGKPLYKYARKGEEIPQKSKKVVIYSIKIIKLDCSNVSKPAYRQAGHGNTVEMEIECGSGTYIRQLAYDILKTLGIESYLEKLTRLQVGEIGISDCQKLTESLDMEGLKE